jgi:hypothetical protein
MMKFLLSITFLLPFFSLAQEVAPLFFIERNKNKNQVHYQLLVDGHCHFSGKKPVDSYWKDLEIGPDAQSGMSAVDYLGYGINGQNIEGEWVHFTLQAVKDRVFRARALKKNKLCMGEAWTTINGQKAILKKVYIHATEGLLLPTVNSIRLEGQNDSGRPIQEEIIVK